MKLSLLQLVKVQGRDGVYLVCRINSARRCVDLVPWDAEYALDRDVPFAELRSLADERAAA